VLAELQHHSMCSDSRIQHGKMIRSPQIGHTSNGIPNAPIRSQADKRAFITAWEVRTAGRNQYVLTEDVRSADADVR